jgi:hypothetical protein
VPFPGEERFAETRLVLSDDRIGGGKDMASRPEVLLEADVDGVGKVVPEAPNKRHIRATPAVN